jgi:mono/diheme cytochrome c family protein
MFIGCSESKTKIEQEKALTKDKIDPSTNRWYTKAMAEHGKPLYEKNCSSCHGIKGEGKKSVWNLDISKSKYSIPSLTSETSHAQYHSLNNLRLTLRDGGAPIGGLMPSFRDKLSKDDIDDIIAYFQSFWTQEYYERWLKNGESK